MKAWDFSAVVYDGTVYCDDANCLPTGITSDDPNVMPIFTTDEADSYPVCDTCGRVHDYIGLTDDGRRYERSQARKQARRQLRELREMEREQRINLGMRVA